MKEHSLCQTVVGAPSGQERYTLASGIPSSSKSGEKKTTTLKRFVGFKAYLKESHTPNLLALCMFRLYLLQLIRHISALASEELE